MDNMIFGIILSPGGVITWLVVGLIAGWLAGLMMKGGGYGILGDIIVGLIGSFLGGVIVSFFVEGRPVSGKASSLLSSSPRPDLLGAGDQRAPSGLSTVMEINAIDRIAGDRFAYRNCAAIASEAVT